MSQRRLTYTQVLEIRHSDESLRTLAARMGVHPKTIHFARTRLTYKYVGSFDAGTHTERATKRKATGWRKRNYEAWRASLAKRTA